MKKIGIRGFTLIELLVVIAIIGMLSTIVLVSLGGVRKKGRDTKRVADLKQLQLALEMYYDTNRVYPPGATAAAALGNLVTAGLIQNVPTDPLTGNNYFYAALAVSGGTTCNAYHLGAILEEAGNAALLNDSDTAVGTLCTGSTVADFAGASAACTVTVGTDQCYDIHP